MSEPDDPMAEIRASFFEECEELLEALQDGLQAIDDGVDDAETINVVFRAVHSIKGGAGAFGLEALVRFSHRLETAMDEVRSGRMSAEGTTLKVFFQAADHLSDLVRASSDGLVLPLDQTAPLLAALDELLGEKGGGQDEPEEEIDFQPTGLALDLDLGADGDLPPLGDIPDLPALTVAGDLVTYHIEFTPHQELFETGNEPFLLLRNLQLLGECSVTPIFVQIPDLALLIPELPSMSWKVELRTQADAAEIASIFEFVEGLCGLKISRDDDKSEGVSVTSDLAALTSSPVVRPGVAQHETEPATLSPEPINQNQDTTPAVDSAQPLSVVPMKKPAQTPGDTAKTPHAANAVVRVDLDRIERLVNLVGELVINQAMLSQSLEQSGLSPHCDAMNGLEEFQRLTRDIQESVMMIRAQPVKSLFQRMSRIVREASAAVGKDVRLHTEGETAEVDKTVIERLADPLTHMIRNAVDHGLETTEDRISVGKPAQGRINLSAAHRSGRVIIEISDDGVGIDRPKVLQTAIDKGLVPPDAALSDTEIDNLLFLPGFSTAKVVSDLSGRGVGMDVVRTSIQSLGGRITITSAPKQGTKLSISLPLTLAVLDGMIIEVESETLVVPLNVVIETLTLSAGDVETVRPGLDVVRVRGTFVPIFDLGAELGYRGPIASYEDAVVLVIAHEDGNRAAMVIDSIQDQRQVVIKGLDDSFHRAPGIAAATILGDGQIALILDPSDIIMNATKNPGVPNLPLATGT